MSGSERDDKGSSAALSHAPAREERDLAPLDALPAELAGFRDVDLHVFRIAGRMAANDWARGTAAREYAATYGISESRVDNWAAEASRLNRLTGVVGYLKTKALHVTDRVMGMAEANPALALAAAKLILERTEAKGPGSGDDAAPHLEELLRPGSTPPELEALLARTDWFRGERVRELEAEVARLKAELKERGT